MGRPPGSTNRLPAESAPTRAGLLAALGVTELAITDVPPVGERSQFNLELYPEEKAALEAAADAAGISKSGAKLARAILRSWLALDWHHTELGTRAWKSALKKLRAEALWWTEGTRPSPAEVVLTILDRLDREDRVRVLVGAIGQLDPNARAEIRRALDG
jgi:hypothetical protein